MTEPDMRELLVEVADDVEPGDRLDAIRARTRRSRTTYWVPAGAALVAASVVGAVALGSGPTDRTSAPGPAGSTSPSTSSPSEPSPTTGESTPTPTEAPGSRAVAVYHLGETPFGTRLYREFRRLPPSDPLDAAAVALGQAPSDPDYRSAWPAGAVEDVSFDGVGADGVIGVSLRDASYRDRPADMSETEARLAVEQVIRTLQAAVQARAAVQFSLDGDPVDQVLGVPTSEPLSQGPDLEVLAHVSIASPSEGQVVDNDDPLVVSGAGNSWEGTIVVRLEEWGPGAVVHAEEFPIAGWMEDRLFPFEVALDVSEVPQGAYVVTSRTDDPSGEDRVHLDSRRVTLTD